MRRRYRFLAWFALGLVIVGPWPPQGWAADPGLSNQPALNEKELLAYKAKGRGVLSGQVFLSASSGKAITQAGASVHLIPVIPYTRYWFDHNVRTSSCASSGEPPPGESAAPRRPADCARDALAQLLAQQRLLSSIRTTRANPTGHFWFTKIPAGRYYIVSLIEGGAGLRQDEQGTGLAWLTIDLDTGEKAANLVVTDCRSNLC
jgi:hypothetical protein